MRILAGIALLLVLATVPSSAQAPLLDQELHAAAALQASVAAATTQDPALVPTFRLAPIPAGTRKQHALGETLLLVGAGAVLVGAISGGGGGTVLVVGGVACAAYGVYLVQL